MTALTKIEEVRSVPSLFRVVSAACKKITVKRIYYRKYLDEVPI